MSTTVERHSHQPSRPADAAPLPLQRRLSAGEVEQRFSRGRSKAVTVEVRRRAAPIRAWRAAEADLTQIPKQEARAPVKAGAPAPRQPFIRDAGAGARPNAVERATRMRAIEQAWKHERARQAELEADEQRGTLRARDAVVAGWPGACADQRPRRAPRTSRTKHAG